MGKLDNKVVIITGAASGIGLASARLFAAQGASIVAADINEEDGVALVQEITGAGGRAIFVRTNVIEEQEVQTLVQTAVDRLGDLDIMYNNAGIEEYHRLTELPIDSWDRQMDVNLKGTFLGCKFALHYFMKKGQGVILNTSSINGILPSPNRPAYNASKAGIILLTKNIALEYGKYNVRANVLCPGAVYTRMTSLLSERPDLEERARSVSVLHRIAQPEEIARAALFLVSDDASFITGTSLVVDGGLSLCANFQMD